MLLPLTTTEVAVSPAQVEVEPVEIRRGDEVDRRDAGERALERGRVRRGRRVIQVEVVVHDVDPAVAREREIRIARAVGTGSVPWRPGCARCGGGVVAPRSVTVATASGGQDDSKMASGRAASGGLRGEQPTGADLR